MENVELIEHPALLVSMRCLLYSCRDHILVFKMLLITKPLNKLMKLGDIWNDRMIWSRINKSVKHFKNKLLIC